MLFGWVLLVFLWDREVRIKRNCAGQSASRNKSGHR
ncbi:unnamed protein product [Amoebophrya sp. A25]|nr:unnamed protein product [Amoebophrya sp. A25]|eukprot:GSA25T00024299001.1